MHHCNTRSIYFISNLISLQTYKNIKDCAIKDRNVINTFFTLAKLTRQWQITFFLLEYTEPRIHYRDSNTGGSGVVYMKRYACSESSSLKYGHLELVRGVKGKNFRGRSQSGSLLKACLEIEARYSFKISLRLRYSTVPDAAARPIN